MLRRRLTAQDAFIGVRADSPADVEEEAPAPASESSPTEPPVPAPQLAAPATAEGAVAPPRSLARPRARADQDLAAALQAAQAALAARTAVERLTLYLPPDLSGDLEHLCQQVREGSRVKVGKSVLAAAALRIVLADPGLRAQAAAGALRQKLG